MAKSKRKFVFYFFVVIVVVSVVYLLFNEYGIIRYSKMQDELDSLKLNLESVKIENQNLKLEIDSLKNKTPAKMEQVAREKYNMKREGETTIEVEEK